MQSRYTLYKFTYGYGEGVLRCMPSLDSQYRKEKFMTSVVIVEREGCSDCANANDLLERIQQERRDLTVRHVQAADPLGRTIIAELSAVEVPVVLVNGHYVAQGAISESLLRERIGSTGHAVDDRTPEYRSKRPHDQDHHCDACNEMS